MAKFHFLILGGGRGGTSLLAALLNQHPHISCAMEAFAYDYLVGGRRKFWMKDSTNLRVSSFVSKCKQEAKKNPKELYGNKITTEQLMRSQAVSSVSILELINVLPLDLKIIFCLRDARAQVVSKVNRAEKSIEQAAKLWNKAAEFQEIITQNFSSNILTVKYEDLLSDTQNFMQIICNFLMIDFHPSLLQLDENNNLPDIYQAQKQIQAEKAFLEDNPEWLPLVNHHMKRLGYL